MPACAAGEKNKGEKRTKQEAGRALPCGLYLARKVQHVRYHVRKCGKIGAIPLACAMPLMVKPVHQKPLTRPVLAHMPVALNVLTKPVQQVNGGRGAASGGPGAVVHKEARGG